MTFQQHRSARIKRPDEEKVCDEVMERMGKARILSRPRRCTSCGLVCDMEDLVRTKYAQEDLSSTVLVCPNCQGWTEGM